MVAVVDVVVVVVVLLGELVFACFAPLHYDEDLVGLHILEGIVVNAELDDTAIVYEDRGELGGGFEVIQEVAVELLEKLVVVVDFCVAVPLNEPLGPVIDATRVEVVRWLVGVLFLLVVRHMNERAC